MLAGDLGRRTGRSESYPRSSLGVPRQVLTHGAVKLTFRGGEIFGTHPSPPSLTDVHTWNQFVEEQGVEIGEYPTEAQAVTFATWLSMRRERVCLAQREGSTARLTGLVKRTVRNMMTELFAHAWPRQLSAFASLER